MITTYADDAQQCSVCKQVRTTGRDENDNPICAACSNDIYYEKKKKGEIIELKIDMTKVKRSTLMAIQAMIQRDVENAAKQQPQPGMTGRVESLKSVPKKN